MSSLQYQEYIINFQGHGFENVSFIAGSINEKDLADMGIKNQGHRKKLMTQIEALPPVEYIQDVPEDVEEWLINLGLERYWPKFKEEDVKETKDLAQLKTMDSKQLSESFNMTKRGHLRKLKGAVKFLQYATKSQKLIRETRDKMSSSSVLMGNLPDDELNFWNRLKKHCLLPEQDAFNHSKELGEKLSEMRTRVFITWFVANALWMTFIGTITYQGSSIQLMGESFVGVIFTFLFAFILLIQFVALLIHRIETLIHFIARASGKLTSDNDSCKTCPDEPLRHANEYSAV